MTVREHSRLLGIFFTIHAVLYSLGIGLGVLMYGAFGFFFAAGYGKRSEQGLGIIFIVMTIVLLVIGLFLIVPQILAAFKLLKNKDGARFWAIFGAITAIISFPLGTALGVYALVFLFGDQGKQLGVSNIAPPPPPNSWQ